MFLSARGSHHILKFAVSSDVLTSGVGVAHTYSGQTTPPRDSWFLELEKDLLVSVSMQTNQSRAYTPTSSFTGLSQTRWSPGARYQATRDSLYAPEPAGTCQTGQTLTCLLWFAFPAEVTRKALAHLLLCLPTDPGASHGLACPAVPSASTCFWV